MVTDASALAGSTVEVHLVAIHEQGLISTIRPHPVPLNAYVFLNSKSYRVSTSQVELSASGKWTFFARRIDYSNLGYGVWHNTNPLAQFSNQHTHLILHILQVELMKWLDPNSMYPVVVPDRFQLLPLHVSRITPSLRPEHIKSETLKIIFDYADLLGEKARVFCFSKLPRCHFVWATSNVDTTQDYPQPDLHALLRDASSGRRDAFLLLMRCAWNQDGGVEHLFERYLWPALRLMFPDPYVVLVPSEGDRAIPDSHSTHPIPLLFVCESPELTDTARIKIAEAVHPTLLRLLNLHEHKDVLPEYCFVYGLHLSRTRLTVFVHFPTPTSMRDGSIQWEFVQILVASHVLSVDWDIGSTYEDTFLWRWRILIVLCTIARHIQVLEQELGLLSTSTESNYRPGQIDCAPYRPDVHFKPQVEQRFPVPLDWIMPESFDIDTTILAKRSDMAVQLLHQLASVAFYPIRKCLTPMSRSFVLENHLAPLSDDPVPDYIHPLHVPRAFFKVKTRDLIDTEVNTRPHFYKARDFLTMTSPGWEDVSIFLANLFAGFSEYAVRWKPTVCYPSEITSCSSQQCIVDFALAVQAIPPATTATILRAPPLPLTILSPAVFLGVRSTSFDDHGLHITDNEMAELRDIMTPHLLVFQLAQRYEDAAFSMNDAEIDPNPALFCTYLKKDYVHLLSFQYDETQAINVHLLNTFPLTLDYTCEQDLLSRMQIVLALLTLQRQVVEISKNWGSICWPEDVLLDEHDIIFKETGVSTPTPTEDLPPRDENATGGFDSGSEDDPEVLKVLMVRSVERVSKWLADLEASGEDFECPWTSERPLSLLPRSDAGERRLHKQRSLSPIVMW
ncbi:hypothetical protein NM688_g2109 [Phlebia brevispora]|uniref:Uncharacterized protein n=1 Tax=Phlebia brevispora TaxID=194682 RepID=A0ACC1T9T3_9APHY|nr:hypothetical protein NM688_g2109 [Phlebia brevispora]